LCPTRPGDPRRRPERAWLWPLPSARVIDSTWSADWMQARVHLEFLERHGYVLSDAERQELNRATAEENNEAEPGE